MTVGGVASGRSWMTGSRAGVVWLILGASLTALVAASMLIPEAPGELPSVFALVFTLVAASLGIVGALIVTRRPGNAVGWILLMASVAVVLGVAASEYGRLLAVSGFELPGYVIATWITGFAPTPAIAGVIILVPLLFPDGHLLTPRWRWAAAFGVTMIALLVIRNMFTPGPLTDHPQIENPAGVPALSVLAPVLEFANGPGTMMAAVLGIASAFVRYRRGTTVERTQLRWFGAATALTLFLFSLAIIFQNGPIADLGWLGGVISLSLIPVAIGIAILRYRLYEIDRIISRTVGWTIVTGLLAAVFAVVVVVLQSILSQFSNENTLAVAASTLVAFALFQPLRRRVQRAVDRRFDRARYDGQRTVDGFAEHLRSDVDLASLRGSLAATADQAVRPASASVWLSPRGTR